MLDNTANQLSKFRTKNWTETTDDRNRVYGWDNFNAKVEFMWL